MVTALETFSYKTTVQKKKKNKKKLKIFEAPEKLQVNLARRFLDKENFSKTKKNYFVTS